MEWIIAFAATIVVSTIIFLDASKMPTGNKVGILFAITMFVFFGSYILAYFFGV